MWYSLTNRKLISLIGVVKDKTCFFPLRNISNFDPADENPVYKFDSDDTGTISDDDENVVGLFDTIPNTCTC